MNDGARFYAFELLSRLEGGTVRFAREVCRGSWKIPEGSTGTLMAPCHDSDGRIFAAVKLDDPPADLLAEFDGEIHWIEDETLDDIQQDILVRPKKV